MSRSLYWRPVDISNRSFPYDLKEAISKKLWGSGGCGEAAMTINDIPYVEGLRDAGVKGAQELIDVLDEHKSIILWLES